MNSLLGGSIDTACYNDTEVLSKEKIQIWVYNCIHKAKAVNSNLWNVWEGTDCLTQNCAHRLDPWFQKPICSDQKAFQQLCLPGLSFCLQNMFCFSVQEPRKNGSNRLFMA